MTSTTHPPESLDDLIEPRRLLDALRLSEARFRALVENLPFGIAVMDRDFRIRYTNAGFDQMFERARGGFIGQTCYREYEKHEQPCAHCPGARTLAEQDAHQVETRGVRDDGSVFHVRNRAFRHLDEQGELHGFIEVVEDITAQKQAEAALNLAASVFDSAHEGILVTDTHGTIVDVNAAFTMITGYARAEVIGKGARLLNSGHQGAEFYAEMWRTLHEHGHWQGDVWNRRKNGEVYAELLTVRAVRDHSGQTSHFVGLFSDITAQKEQQRQLEHIVHFDALTGLPNRSLFSDRLNQAMAQVQRRGARIALAYVDLDGFKAINDQYGHKVGDQLLVRIAQRMKDTLREGDTIARLGGDEFVAVLIDLPDLQASVPLIVRLLTATAQPVSTDAAELRVSGSIGVTFYPQDNEIDADQLLRQADQAMYQAKLAGRNRYHVFDAEQDRNVRGHHESLERIRLGLESSEFVLYYQPKVNMRSGEVIGAEALVRWQHPQRGLLSPAAFLSEIEDHVLGTRLDAWVLENALSQMSAWQCAGLRVPVSVNVSALDLQRPDFIVNLRAALARHPDLSPNMLELEVLETSALNDIDLVSAVIKSCAEIGVGFALDDFGTGYSSLTYLKRLPASVLKIDQSFVHDMLNDPDDLAILEGVIGLANAFSRRAIAEGVESVEHGRLLLRLGCEYAQGYAIARPMPAIELPGWIARWQPDVLWQSTRRSHREDLPLIYVAVELRAWVEAIEASLRGRRFDTPLLAPSQHRFDQWLNQSRATGRHSEQILLDVLNPKNHWLHQLAIGLLEARTRDDGKVILAKLHELREACDEFLRDVEQVLDRRT